MQVVVAQVRAVRLHSQRHEALFVYWPALVRFGLVQVGALQVFPRARGAGDDRDGALPWVCRGFLSSRAAFTNPAGRVGCEGIPPLLHRAGLVVLPVFGSCGDLAGVRSVFIVSIFALVVAVFVTVAEICRGKRHLLTFAITFQTCRALVATYGSALVSNDTQLVCSAIKVYFPDSHRHTFQAHKLCNQLMTKFFPSCAFLRISINIQCGNIQLVFPWWFARQYIEHVRTVKYALKNTKAKKQQKKSLYSTF